MCASRNSWGAREWFPKDVMAWIVCGRCLSNQKRPLFGTASLKARGVACCLLKARSGPSSRRWLLHYPLPLSCCVCCAVLLFFSPLQNLCKLFALLGSSKIVTVLQMKRGSWIRLAIKKIMYKFTCSGGETAARLHKWKEFTSLGVCASEWACREPWAQQGAPGAFPDML